MIELIIIVHFLSFAYAIQSTVHHRFYFAAVHRLLPSLQFRGAEQRESLQNQVTATRSSTINGGGDLNIRRSLSIAELSRTEIGKLLEISFVF